MANYPQYSYSQSDVSIYRTDAYGGANDDVASTEKFSSDISLESNIGATVDVRFTAIGGSPTDNFVINIYKRRNSSWDGTEEKIYSRSITQTGSEKTQPINLDLSLGAGHFRLGFKSAGATTSFDVYALYRSWRFTIATS